MVSALTQSSVSNLCTALTGYYWPVGSTLLYAGAELHVSVPVKKDIASVENSVLLK